MSIEDIATPEEINTWLKEYKTSTDNKIKIQLRNLIVLAYLPLVRKLSHGLARRGTDPVEDLIQVGSLGLLKAINQYDVKFGASFKTYATYFITGEIRHYLRDKATMIRAPRELQELSIRINNLIQQLTLKLGKVPSNLEIAQELEISVNRIVEICDIDRRKQTISLDQVLFDNTDSEHTLIDKLIDDKYQDFLIAQEDRIMLAEVVEMLKPSLKEVIELSFFDDMSQNEIAKHLNISQMQVSRRLKKAITELFNIITAKTAQLELDG